MNFAFDWAVFWSVLAALGVWAVVYIILTKARVIVVNEAIRSVP